MRRSLVHEVIIKTNIADFRERPTLQFYTEEQNIPAKSGVTTNNGAMFPPCLIYMVWEMKGKRSWHL